MVQIDIKYLVDPSQKDPTSALGKWKMDFSCNENENFLWQTRWAFKYTHTCKIWDHLGKLSFEMSYNFGHLARKPWTFILDSPFCEDFFNRFAVFQVCWFVWLLVHKIGCNAKVFNFWFFSNCSCRFQNGSKRGEGAWPVIARGGILENSWWFSDQMTTFIPRNDLKKIKTKLSSTCSSNFTSFQLNQRQFAFFRRGV